MDWVSRMNEAMNYIEENLTEKITYEELAKISYCSVHHFQRMFAFITDVSLSEYIRRRRLTLAAIELQKGRVKVLDLALKYGYESPEAFTRAFHHMHGTTPTAARNLGTKLKLYPRLSFQFTLEGVAELNYRIETTHAFSIVGVREYIGTEDLDIFNTFSKIRNRAKAQGVYEKLREIQTDGHSINGILGVCTSEEWKDREKFYFMLAVPSSSEPPEDMTSFTFPETTWAVFEADGPPENMESIYKRLYKEWLPNSKYNFAHSPSIECYLEGGKNELWVALEPSQ